MKIIKIIAINIVIIAISIIGIEIITYNSQLAIEHNQIALIKRGFIFNSFNLPIKNFKKAVIQAEQSDLGGRISYRNINEKYEKYVNKKKKSIILYGCSYAMGVGLKDEETFGYFLQKLTGRKVYNRSLAGYGIQHMLYLVKNNINLLIKKENFIESEYAIYLYIENQIKRLYRPNDYFDIYLMFYKWNKDKTNLVEYKDIDMWFWHSYYLRNMYINKNEKLFTLLPNGEIMLSKEMGKYLSMFFILANRELKKHFPNIKFVIFVYDGNSGMKKIQNSLEQEGIKIVYLSELTKIDFKNRKYIQSDNVHPNNKVWKIVTPLFIKSIGL